MSHTPKSTTGDITLLPAPRRADPAPSIFMATPTDLRSADMMVFGAALRSPRSTLPVLR
jgi:hypothetical protein